MGTQAIEGGYDTARVAVAANDQQHRDRQRAAAFGNLSAFACDWFIDPNWYADCDGDADKWTGDIDKLRAARAYRDEIAAALGLTPRKAGA